MKKAIANTLYWATWLFIYSLAIIVAGSLVGALLFWLVGFALPGMPSWEHRVFKGLTLGARFAGVWAMGFSIVLCFIQSHRKNTQHNTLKHT